MPEKKEASVTVSPSGPLQHVRRRLSSRLSLKKYPLVRGFVGEFVGTCVLVIYGCGVLAQVMLGHKEHGGFLSIALGWGMAVTMGVYFGSIGHSHINPAVTLAFAVIGKIPFRLVPIYTAAQISGAFVGALCVVAVNYEQLERAAAADDGAFTMNRTGGIFVTRPHISTTGALFDQIFGTALLSGGALAIVDPNTFNLPGYLHPLCLGLMVTTIVGCFALNAGAALNPARDLGPRLAIWMCGWGNAAFTDKHYYFWVPIVGPYVGATLGAVLYELLIGIHTTKAPEFEEAEDHEQKIYLSSIHDHADESFE